MTRKELRLKRKIGITRIRNLEYKWNKYCKHFWTTSLYWRRVDSIKPDNPQAEELYKSKEFIEALKEHSDYGKK